MPTAKLHASRKCNCIKNNMKPLMDSVYSFIHYGDLYSAPSRLLLRSAPDPCAAKKKSFEAGVECVKESWGAIVATKEAHYTQRGQPSRMHGPGLWRYEDNNGDNDVDDDDSVCSYTCTCSYFT